MAHPYHHALSSVKKWGGNVDDYQAIHAWFDSSKAQCADFPTRWVGEQHVREDLGFIPSFTDWVKTIRPEPWMGRAEKIEALVEPHLAPPVLEVR
jgi:hypothetical protein